MTYILGWGMLADHNAVFWWVWRSLMFEGVNIVNILGCEQYGSETGVQLPSNHNASFW